MNWVFVCVDRISILHTDRVVFSDGIFHERVVYIADVTDPRITPDRFKHTRPDRVVFSDLTREDPMVIQCNATNKHGYIWGDVFLNVLCEFYSSGMGTVSQ